MDQTTRQQIAATLRAAAKIVAAEAPAPVSKQAAEAALAKLRVKSGLIGTTQKVGDYYFAFAYSREHKAFTMGVSTRNDRGQVMGLEKGDTETKGRSQWMTDNNFRLTPAGIDKVVKSLQNIEVIAASALHAAASRLSASTGAECELVELAPGQWYAFVQNYRSDDDEDNDHWEGEWIDVAGPASSSDAAYRLLTRNHANPGGSTESSFKSLSARDIAYWTKLAKKLKPRISLPEAGAAAPEASKATPWAGLDRSTAARLKLPDVMGGIGYQWATAPSGTVFIKGNSGKLFALVGDKVLHGVFPSMVNDQDSAAEVERYLPKMKPIQRKTNSRGQLFLQE